MACTYAMRRAASAKATPASSASGVRNMCACVNAKTRKRESEQGDCGERLPSLYHERTPHLSASPGPVGWRGRIARTLVVFGRFARSNSLYRPMDGSRQSWNEGRRGAVGLWRGTRPRSFDCEIRYSRLVLGCQRSRTRAPSRTASMPQPKRRCEPIAGASHALGRNPAGHLRRNQW
jgi:hypothetical protein